MLIAARPAYAASWRPGEKAEEQPRILHAQPTHNPTVSLRLLWVGGCGTAAGLCACSAPQQRAAPLRLRAGNGQSGRRAQIPLSAERI